MLLNLDKRIKAVVCLFILSFSILSNINFALAEDYGLEDTARVVGDALPRTTSDQVPVKIGKLIGEVLALVGILFFGLIIYAGFMWMTARGNEQQVSKSKDLIINAVIGLIVILSAYAITSYVGSILTAPE